MEKSIPSGLAKRGTDLASVLLDTESKYRSIFEVITDAIVIVDRDGLVVEANPVACSLFARSHSEISGIAVEQLFLEKHRNDLQSFLQEIGQGKYAAREYDCIRSDGSIITTEVRATPCFLSCQMHYYLALQDITLRRQAEIRQKELLAILEAKNEELENVIYVTSHDLRSPLINIKGFGKELADVVLQVRSLINNMPGELDARLLPLLDEEFPTCLGFINKSIERMDLLLNGLLYLSRIGRLPCEIESLNMNQLLAQLRDGLQYQIQQSGAEITLENLPPCRGDRTQIGQVFTNLLDNALKYRHRLRPCRIRVSCCRNGKDQVVYAVQDNGMGIPKQHFSRIFAMFHRLHPKDTIGEGIGLPATLRLLQRNQGQIWVESVEGVGSTFLVTLPAVPGEN